VHLGVLELARRRAHRASRASVQWGIHQEALRALFYLLKGTKEN